MLADIVPRAKSSQRWHVKHVLVPIHPEGWRFAALFAIAGTLLFWVWVPLGWIGVVLTLWCVYFFRNPDRVVPQREGLVIAPADGRVCMITETHLPSELDRELDRSEEEKRIRVSIFMNVFNVHVNRAPVPGKILAAPYVKGKFLNADLDKASEANERQLLLMETGEQDTQTIAIVQIAGLVARRIRCDVVPGQVLKAGERFGLIRFGSRVDVYLPAGVAPLVSVGQLTAAGETVLADLSAPRPQTPCNAELI